MTRVWSQSENAQSWAKSGLKQPKFKEGKDDSQRMLGIAIFGDMEFLKFPCAKSRTLWLCHCRLFQAS